MSRFLFIIFLSGFILLTPLNHRLLAENTSFSAPNSYTSQSQDIINTMIKASDWMRDNRISTPGGKKPEWSWTNAVWYIGILELYKVTNNEQYLKQLLSIGEKLEWGLGPRQRFADDQCIGQVYTDLYLLLNRPQVIAKTRKAFDAMITENVDLPLENHHTVCLEGEWSWSDSLFMAPPVLTKLYQATGEKKYLDFMNKKWWKTYDFLYDPDEHLYFRDASYFDLKEKNGEKIFWSRGNGWVLAGLVRVLEDLPVNFPDHSRYIALYTKMSEKIAALQQPDGFWRSSLLDPEAYHGGETSGTALYCYALAWGISHGYLSRDRYLSVVMHAWEALKSTVHDSGKIGYIQRMDGAPNRTLKADTDVFGVGTFLLAGCAVTRLLQLVPEIHSKD